MTIVTTQFEYILWCTECHTYFTSADVHRCIKKEYVMKRKRLGILKKMEKLTPKTIEKLERERARLLEGVRQNQAKVKAIDKILVKG